MFGIGIFPLFLSNGNSKKLKIKFSRSFRGRLCILTLLCLTAGATHAQQLTSDAPMLYSNQYSVINVTQDATAASWSPNGKALAIASGPNLTVVDPDTHTVVRELSVGAHGDGRCNVKYSADGNVLAFGIHDIYVYDAHDFSVLHVLPMPFKIYSPSREPFVSIKSIAISPNSDAIAVLYRGIDLSEKARDRQGIAVFDLRSGAFRWSAILPIENALSNAPLLFSKNGEAIYCGAGNIIHRGAEMWRTADLLSFDTRTGAMRTLIKNILPDVPTAMALSHDGIYLAVGTDAGRVMDWLNLKTNKYVTFSGGNSINVYDLRSGKLALAIPSPSLAEAFAFDKGDRYLWVSVADIQTSKNISAYDLHDGTLVQQFDIGTAMALEINPVDGTLAAIGGRGAFLFKRVQ